MEAKVIVIETTDNFLTVDDICKKDCVSALSLYIKVKNDFEIARKSLIEAITNLKSKPVYSTLITADKQTTVDNNLSTLNNITME